MVARLFDCMGVGMDEILAVAGGACGVSPEPTATPVGATWSDDASLSTSSSMGVIAFDVTI